MLRVTGKMKAVKLVVGVCRMTEGLNDDEEGGSRAGRGCVNQI